MGVRVQRDTDVGVAHDVLQRLGVHAALRHVGAERVPAHMGRDLGHLPVVLPGKLSPDILEAPRPVRASQRHPVPAQIEEAASAVNDLCHLGHRPGGDQAAETVVHVGRHGDFPLAADGLGV